MTEVYILDTTQDPKDTKGCKSGLTQPEYDILPDFIKSFYIKKELLR